MKKKLIYTYILIGCFGLYFSLSSCKKDETPDATDQQLYEMAKVSSGFLWYANSDALRAKTSGSGHLQPFLRTRYNDIASAKLGSNGKVVAGTVFPEGSVIVKELYSDPSTLAAYAILYKQTGHKNADAKGWVWGYVDANGNVVEASAKKGVSCNSCHSQSDNIDNTLMNKSFP